MNPVLRELGMPGPLARSAPPRPSPVAGDLLDAMTGGDAEGRSALARGEALCVVTGQQPGFPLPLGLTLQKVATAVAKAALMGREMGCPVLPVFWNGSDDSDFEEARGQRLARSGAAPIQVRLPDKVHRKGAFVGDVPIAGAYREFAARLGDGELPSDWAAEESEDLGTQQGRILMELFRPWGLMVLDARQPALRSAAEPLFRTYAKNRTHFSELLDETGEQLARELGERPLREGLGDRALYFQRRRRRVLPEIAEYGVELERRLADRPEQLSPNAALRPVVQDGILPVAAAVLGPSEWNYHRQLRPVFDLMGVGFPEALPRLAASWEGDRKRGLDDEGRSSSPLTRPGHPLGDPTNLIDLATKHLARWEEGGLFAFDLPDEEGV